MHALLFRSLARIGQVASGAGDHRPCRRSSAPGTMLLEPTVLEGARQLMASSAARIRASSPAGRLPPGGSQASIELYWLPLGAGGWFVRLNGRIYEAIHALLQHRRPLDLYHTALVVRVPEGRFVVENCWPIPDGDGSSRGVLVEGPVGSRRRGRWRVFRYEVRRWRNGVIADADEAVASPQLLSDDPFVARHLLELVGCLPSPVWGRDQLGTGEMWNSNSVIAWLLAQSGLSADAIRPPAGGRAPGWQAGLVTARRQQPINKRAGQRKEGASTTVGGSRVA